MNLKNLLFENEAGIGILTINRPEVRNALNLETWREIKTVVDFVREDKATKVLVITGAGDKAFAAGADIHYLRARSMLETLIAEGQQILWELENLLKPVVAAVNGFALGGGCELALACDFRIASENARFGQPELNLGILPGAGGTQRLPRLVGIGKAKELIFTGEIITAAEAEKIGLVNKVVPLEALMPTVKEICQKMLSKGPLALKLAKEVINLGTSTDLKTGLTLERFAQTVIFGTEERIEGLTAFLEKRPPVYKES